MRNFKLKTLVAAVALAAGGSAAAATIGAEGLFFSAFNGNPDAPSSIVINLGETSTQFKTTPTASRSLATSDPTALTTLSTWLNGNSANLGTIRWSIYGRMAGVAPTVNFGGLATMAVPNANTAINDCLSGATVACGNNTGTTRINTVNGNLELFLNSPATGANPNLQTQNAFAANDTNQRFFASQNGGVSYETRGGLNQSLLFYSFFPQQGVSATISNARGSVSGFPGPGQWNFSFAPGTGASLSYSAVPVPAAVWLLGSALTGLVGVSRRRG